MPEFEWNLDPNALDPRRPYAGDEALQVEFKVLPVFNQEKSDAEGRPVYDNEEFSIIYVNKDEIVFHQLSLYPRDKQRFAQRYAAWKQSGVNDPAAVGTPLAQWGMVNAAQVEELRYFKIVTVEQLAVIADSTVQRIPGLQRLKQQAQVFVQMQKDEAPFQKMDAELKKRDEENQQLRDTVARMQEQMNQLLAAQQQKAEPEARPNRR